METSEVDRARAFEAIERSIREQARLVDDILDLSCVRAATLRLDLRTVEPATVIEAAIERLRLRSDLKSIRVEAALDRSAMPLIADPNRLAQVVASLLANAIKFTPAGGRVQVRLERAGAFARIQVIDSGHGIGREFLPRVFERFRQADSSSTRAYGGLGIGLALVKSLVELQGGRVSAESAGDDKGATFTIDLPLAGSPPETAAPPEAPAAETWGKRRALAGIRVLIVDDDADLRDMLQSLLERHGACVTAAGSAAEALGALESSMPDVLLSDVAMPGASGYDLMRKVAARPGGCVLPAAALSAFSREQDRQQALAAGFRMHLAKPIAPDALVAAVAGLAGRAVTSDSEASRTR
jgi:CheY-like chemotaxis protein/two-component sensor histidine kinase